MENVLVEIRRRRAELHIELRKLDAAEAAMTGRAIDPPEPESAESPAKKPEAATASSESRGEPKPPASPLTLEQCRSILRDLLTVHGPLTPNRMEKLSPLSSWQVTKSLRQWAEVEKAGTALRDPYRLKAS